MKPPKLSDVFWLTRDAPAPECDGLNWAVWTVAEPEWDVDTGCWTATYWPRFWCEEVEWLALKGPSLKPGEKRTCYGEPFFVAADGHLAICWKEAEK